MTYDHYHKQKMHLYENILNQILSRNRTLISCLDRDLPHPIMNKYPHIPRHQQREN